MVLLLLLSFVHVFNHFSAHV
jgi:hypothetical protein